MNQEKNHWIALFLTGKYPGSYRTPDKLLFIDSLQAINPKVFSDDKIKMFGMFGQVDEYEFYLNFLNKVERDFPLLFDGFLEKLQLPQEIKNKHGKTFSHTLFYEQFVKMKSITEKQEKGKAFEVFLKEFFGAMEGLGVLEIKQASDEQIDLILKNNVNRPFWIQLGSPLLIGEAKNWTKKTRTQVLHTLKGKMDEHKNFSRIGFVVAMNGFTDQNGENQKRDGSGEKIVFTLTGEEIEQMLEAKKDPIDWLEEKIVKAFV